MTEQMNALVLEGIGNLQYKKVEKPTPKEGEVLVKIKACGICSSDIPRIFKTGTYHFPTIPGHEFSGEIVSIGKNVDSSWIGKRAAVFPLLPCRKCAPCQIQEYAQCKDYNYFGSRCDGAFAEYLSVPVWNLVPFTEKVSFEEGALCDPFAVSLHAFKMSGLQPGDTVAIVGTGTIGFMIAEIAKSFGASKVIVCGRNSSKLKFAEERGFEAVDINVENFAKTIQSITQSDGAKITFECVGAPASANQAIECCGAFGTVVLVGNPTGDINFKKDIYWKLLRQQITVKGTWNSSYNDTVNDWKEALHMMETGKVDFKPLITKRYPLSQSDEALSLLRDPKTFTLKVMFCM